jgi:hypothetical protein
MVTWTLQCNLQIKPFMAFVNTTAGLVQCSHLMGQVPSFGQWLNCVVASMPEQQITFYEYSRPVV